MKLIDPSGTRIIVSDERAEQLLKLRGYRRAEGPAVSAPDDNKDNSSGVRKPRGRRGSVGSAS